MTSSMLEEKLFPIPRNGPKKAHADINWIYFGKGHEVPCIRYHNTRFVALVSVSHSFSCFRLRLLTYDSTDWRQNIEEAKTSTSLNDETDADGRLWNWQWASNFCPSICFKGPISISSAINFVLTFFSPLLFQLRRKFLRLVHGGQFKIMRGENPAKSSSWRRISQVIKVHLVHWLTHRLGQSRRNRSFPKNKSPTIWWFPPKRGKPFCRHRRFRPRDPTCSGSEGPATRVDSY